MIKTKFICKIWAKSVGLSVRSFSIWLLFYRLSLLIRPNQHLKEEILSNRSVQEKSFATYITVREFGKRHIYEQYRIKSAVSQKWRLFFLILIMQAIYRDDEQGQRKTYRDNCNSYNIAMIRHIHQSHKLYYCLKPLLLAKVELFSHPPSPSFLSLTSLRGLGRKEGAERKVE